jgi:sensor domain CHASE-containing protein
MVLKSCNLRARTRIIVGLTSLILFCGQYALARFILLRSFTRLESEQAVANTEKVHSALSIKVREFDRLIGDWAPWDDAYAFMENRNENFVRSNMSASGFTENEIDTLILTDAVGVPVITKGFNLVTRQPQPVYPDLLSLTSGKGALLQHKTIDSKMVGILVLPEKLVFVASRPILQSNYAGPARGTMIMA